MSKNRSLIIYETILLVIVWIVLIVSPLFFRDDDFFEWKVFIRSMETTGPLFLIFLLNRFILVPKLLFSNRIFHYMVGVVALIVLFTIGTAAVSKAFYESKPHPPIQEDLRRPPVNRPGNDPANRPLNEGPAKGPIPLYANFLIFSILLIGFDTGLRASFRLAETERKKAKLESENVGTQLAFLRNQVSPHFFMNTLNNIHSLIDIDTEEAKESVIRLSKLMRHLLYESDNDAIPMIKEMEFIRNYIDLMKLRYSEKVKINLMLPDIIPNTTIPPLLFTSFLDNAFKHGISYEHESFIVVAVTIDGSNLVFEVRNSLAGMENQETREKSMGIGIENSKRRLDLLYKDNYSLEISEKEDSYHLKLIVPL